MNENTNVLWVGLSFLVIGLTIGLLLSGGGSLLNRNSQANIAVEAPNDGLRAEDAIVERISVSIDDDAIKGDPEAPITLLEFSDFQCPFCHGFYAEILPFIEENYIDKGLVKLVYRDYPLPSHTKADEAAMAAECAGEKGDEMYYAMHDLIFDRIAEINSSTDVNQTLVSLAGELGLDIESCLVNEEMLDEVEADFIAASSYGVDATPYFFVNGRKVRGARAETIIQYIEEEIAALNL